MKAKRIVAAFACALLCAALYAPAAFAAELTAGSQGKAKLQDQAATKTVYVLTKVTEKSPGSSSKFTYSYAYNKSGLLKKLTSTHDKQKHISTFSYDKANKLTKISDKPGTTKEVNKYSKGKLIQTTETFKGTSTKNIFKATYKSGKITKITLTNSFTDNKGNKITNKNVYKVSYNKKGLVSKFGSTGYMTSYKYDANGNTIKISYSGGATNYKNTYNSKGNLTKRTSTDSDGFASTRTYTYKRIKVKKAVVSKIKQQQWGLLNEGRNNALSLKP